MSAPLALTIILAVLICLTTVALSLALLTLYHIWQHVLNLQYLVNQLDKIVQVDQERNRCNPSSPASSTGINAPSYPIPTAADPPISWPLERMEGRTPAAHPGAKFPPPADRYPRPFDRNADLYSLPATRESSPRSFI
ncbi:hypothetical protein NU219Hw_g3984t1 [Hortaea werneckii]